VPSPGSCCFAIEGAASYGAGLARYLAGRGLPVFECERPSRRDGRSRRSCGRSRRSASAASDRSARPSWSSRAATLGACAP